MMREWNECDPGKVNGKAHFTNDRVRRNRRQSEPAERWVCVNDRTRWIRLEIGIHNLNIWRDNQRACCCRLCCRCCCLWLIFVLIVYLVSSVLSHSLNTRLYCYSLVVIFSSLLLRLSSSDFVWASSIDSNHWAPVDRTRYDSTSQRQIVESNRMRNPKDGTREKRWNVFFAENLIY